VRLQEVLISGENGSGGDRIDLRTSLNMRFAYWNLKPQTRLNLSVSLFNHEGICVFATTTVTDTAWHGRPFPAGLFCSTCRVPGYLLNAGTYRVRLLFVRDSAVVLYTHDDAAVFEVHDEPDKRGNWFGKWPGVVRPSLAWRTELLDG
jgi:lipopolysaccharide transport system ATP-binding protein